MREYSPDAEESLVECEPWKGPSAESPPRLFPKASASSYAIGECKLEPDAEDNDSWAEPEEVDDDDEDDDRDSNGEDSERLSKPTPGPLVYPTTEVGETIFGVANCSWSSPSDMAYSG